VKRSVAEFLEDRCSLIGASIAYHVLFSLFPLMIVLAGAASLVVNASGLRAGLVHTVVHNLPLSASGQQQLRSLLLGATSRTAGLGLVAIVGLLYSASGMMAALRAALNQAWDVEDARPLLKGKLVDFALVFVIGTLSLASLALTITVRFLTTSAAVPGWAEGIAGICLPLGIAFLTVLCLYRLVPAADVHIADVWPAAVAVSVLLVVLQNLFALYVGNFGHYNAVYGSLGAVIAFMFFVYLAANIFLFGAELASEWPRVALELQQAPPRDHTRGGFHQLAHAARRLWVRRAAGRGGKR
jgi:membrane protein